MKKLCAIFLLLAAVGFGAGCSAPSTTEINRPPADVNGVRHLLLTTSFTPFEGDTFASAAYSDSIVQGFGPDVVILCNSDTIVNTLRIAGGADSGRFIEASTSYNWSYQGPDTSFTFTMSSPGNQFDIEEPEDNSEIEPFLGDSLTIAYEPTGPCSNLIVILVGFIDGETVDTIRPSIQFNPISGTIAPILLDSISQLELEGEGTISIVKISDSIFSIPSIHSIVIKDSAASEMDQIRWED
jgi:hypothetical protein